MKIYHFVPAGYGLEDIKKRRLKIATIPDLNDPFELLCVDLSDENLRIGMRNWKRKMGAQYGMLCFSKTWRNPVQWSHYADRHRGLALGFEVPDGHAIDVMYKEHRSKEEIGELLFSDSADRREEMMQRFLSTKYAHWSYEKEMRIYTTLEEKDVSTGLYFQYFSESLKLSEVIVGAESEVTRSQIREVLGDLASEVSLRNARLAFTSYRVVTQNDPRLWA
jgi:hypothetical protein